jgi:hypothetical protein
MLALIGIGILAIANSVTEANAQTATGYTGAYASDSTNIWRGDRVGMVSFYYDKPQTDPDDDVLSVLSVAGSDGSTGNNKMDGVNGMFYQVFAQYDVFEDDVFIVGNVWGPNSGSSAIISYYPDVITPDAQQALCMTSEVVKFGTSAKWINSRTQVEFNGFCDKMNGMRTVLASGFLTYSREQQDDSQYFLFGKCTGTGCQPDQPSGNTIKFFQFGLESPSALFADMGISQSNIFFLDTADFTPRKLFRIGDYETRFIWTQSDLSWFFNVPENQNNYPVCVGCAEFQRWFAHTDATDSPTLPAGFINWEGNAIGCNVDNFPGKCHAENTLLWNANAGGIVTVGTTTSSQNSPGKGDQYEGEKRVVPSYHDGLTLFAFYYDTANGGIVQKTSTNGGNTWSSLTSLNTGTIVSDSYRWSVVSTTYQGTQYIYVLYWIQGNPDTQNHHFKFMRGTVASNGKSISSWSSPVDLGYTAAHSTCGTGGACAAVVATTDSNGVIYAAFRYKPGGQNNYYFSIKYSNNGGFDWFDSWSHTDIGNTWAPTMALTSLGSGKMLWAYAFYNSGTLNYKVYTPGSGWTSYSTAISGWPTTAYKQMSADYDPTTGKAYIAYVSGGTSGTLKVARFSASDPDYFEATETANSFFTNHELPSITTTPDGIVQIYTISGNTILETVKLNDGWTPATNTYGSSMTSPNQLTASIWYPGAMWREGTASPYSIKYPYGYN